MKKSFAVVAALVFLVSASLAWGDATIVTIVKSGGFKGMGASESSQTRQYRDEMMTYGDEVARRRGKPKRKKTYGEEAAKKAGVTEDIQSSLTAAPQYEVEYDGHTYLWSKHHEFLRFIDLPRRVNVPLELATNLADPRTIQHGVV